MSSGTPDHSPVREAASHANGRRRQLETEIRKARGKGVGFLLAGVLVGVLVVSPWESGAAASTGPATIRITNKEVSVARVDVGRRGESPGDLEIIRQRLFDRQQNRVGQAELDCTFVDSRRARVCRGTYFLPKGELVVGGSLSFRQFYELAVVGGTGLYENARGSVTVTRVGRRPVRDRVVFRLVG